MIGANFSNFFLKMLVHKPIQCMTLIYKVLQKWQHFLNCNLHLL